MTQTREQIRQFLKLEINDHPIEYRVQDSETFEGYTRHRISYTALEGDDIPAYLLIPDGEGKFPAVLALHQHAGERHLGKSEVVGIVGNPLQAYAPVLAKQGFVVLAHDSICFEDRRKHAQGYEPHDRDVMGHFDEMANRLTMGDTLARKVLSDALIGISLLKHHPNVDAEKIGVVGHSYGGNTVLFLAALDTRIQFAVSSGALCSYAYKRGHDVSLELALIIPDFASRWDMQDLLDCIAPRPILIISADDDPFSADASEVIARCEQTDHITHQRYHGGHAITQERFDNIINFVVQQGNS